MKCILQLPGELYALVLLLKPTLVALYTNEMDYFTFSSPDKAKAFQEALGSNTSNAESLIQQIYDNVGNYQAVPNLVDDYGSRFSVTMRITGPNGKTANVLTAWIYDPVSDIPRLINAYVH